MQAPIFENTYFLKSVGWAIGHSFWQAGFLWTLYRLIIASNKQLSAVVKHHLSLALLSTSLIWFLFTISENYVLLANYQSTEALHSNTAWLLPLPQFDAILPAISVIYFFFLVLYALKFTNKLVQNRTLQHNGLTKAPFNLRLYIAHTAPHLGIKRKVQLWISDKVDVPAVTGFIKPIILLPAAIVNHLSTKQVESILLHELAHIKRNDYLINLFQSVTELLLFFNPFVFLLSNTIREERENCCDDWVLNYKYDQLDYASALLVLEEHRQLKPGFALAATNNKKNLLLRVKRLFKYPPDTSFTIWHQVKLACLCLLLFLGVLVSFPVIDATKLKFAAKEVVEKSMLTKPQRDNEISNAKLEENSKPNIVAPAITLKIPETKASRKVITEKSTNKQKNEDYLSALINEELLHENINSEPIAISAPDNIAEDKRYYIKVEEQQSGNTQVNTYYFELNNKAGAPEVKPLLFLKVHKVPVNTNKPVFNKPDSVSTPAKKRVTS